MSDRSSLRLLLEILRNLQSKLLSDVCVSLLLCVIATVNSITAAMESVAEIDQTLK